VKTSSINPSFYHSDAWYDSDFGLPRVVRSGHYKINFKGLKPAWLLKIAKAFMYQRIIRHKFSGMLSFVRTIKNLGEFLEIYCHDARKLVIDRKFILSFIHYVNKKSPLKEATQKGYLTALRTFFEFCHQNRLLHFSKKPIFFDEDFARPSAPTPKFIPEPVLNQLDKYLDKLPAYMKHMVIVIRETGRRISEVSTLSQNCLMTNNKGEHTLKFYDHKMDKEGLIPISQICANAIKAQKQWASKTYPQNKDYLFPGNKGIFCVSPRTFNHNLNMLAQRFKIVDTSGQIWHFHSHQFRHTVGTRMINSGIPQHIVQRYLGHKNSEMTSYYAHILDDTLKKEFQRFQSNLIDVTGKIYDQAQEEKEEIDVHWLRKNILGQALPNGYCALPIWQKRCPHANVCLTCSNFRTSVYFLPEHERHLETTEKVLSLSESKGWKPQVEINKTLKTNLEMVITTLKRGKQ
jgi:integrase